VKILQRWHALNRYERWMLAVVLLATLLRLVLIYCNWPYTDSDEGNMGILAFNAAFQGDHPVFFYGAPYLGPVEAYVAVPLFRLFGSSLFLLRLPLVFFFAIFLLGMYYLIRLLYRNQKFALAMVILLSLGSPDVLFLQLRASGEYPEIEMCAALMCLFAVWLALTASKTEQKTGWRTIWQRLAVYALLGLTIGLALWVDLLVLPFVAAALLLLCIFCWRELVRWTGLSLLVGIIVGAFPLIYYNLTAPWSQNSWFELLFLHKEGEMQMLTSHLTWVNQLTGTFMVSLPMATGGGISCPVSAIPPSGSPTPVTLPCVVFQSGWSVGYVAAGCFAAWLAGYVIWQTARHRRTNLAQETRSEKRQELIRQSGRLMLLVSAALTLVMYADAPSPATSPDTAFRYLTCLFLVLPVLLWPLWQGMDTRKFAVRWYIQAALLLFVGGTLITGTIRTLWQIPSAETIAGQKQAVVQNLLQTKATRVYSDYWTCNILTFLSNEKIICSALDNYLNPGYDRYPPYQGIVAAAPDPTYIFPLGSPQAQAMQQRVKTTHAHYHVYTLESYIIYQPI